MSSLNLKEGIDSVEGFNSFIPTGSLIPKALAPSKLTDYDTEQEILSSGVVPCDGRSLNTYTYRNLHSIISNIYGGTAYSQGVTDQLGQVTTFNIPDLRTSKKYLTGSNTVNPSITNNSNNLTHTHGIALLPGSFGSNLTTGVNHSHGLTYTSNNVNGITAHSHSTNFTFAAMNSGQIAGFTQAKVDGSAVASASNHSHANGAYNQNFSGGTAANTANTAHTHSQTLSTSSEMPSHSHDVSGYVITENASSSYTYPEITILYFIKI
jgi:hypothetical protein